MIKDFNGAPLLVLSVEEVETVLNYLHLDTKLRRKLQDFLYDPETIKWKK